MQQILGALASVLIAMVFMAVAAMVDRKKSLVKTDFDKSTISMFGEDKEFSKIIIPGCLLIGLLNIPFSIGLNNLTGGLGIILNLLSGITSLALILTGISVVRPGGIFHIVMSHIFLGVLFIFEMLVSYKLTKIDFKWGWYMISILLTNLGLTLGLLIKLKKENGVVEIVFLGFSSLWLLITAVFLMVK